MEKGMISNRDSQNIRFVDSLDREFWFSLDRHISDEEFDRKIRDRIQYDFLSTLMNTVDPGNP